MHESVELKYGQQEQRERGCYKLIVISISNNIIIFLFITLSKNSPKLYSIEQGSGSYLKIIGYQSSDKVITSLLDPAPV